MGLIGRMFTVLATLVVVAAAAGAALYVVDYGVEATVTAKGEDSAGHYVVATTRIGGVDVREHLPIEQWTAIQVGNFVVYNIRSEDVTVFAREGGTQIYPAL